jgi:hypothetical protein
MDGGLIDVSTDHGGSYTFALSVLFYVTSLVASCLVFIFFLVWWLFSVQC